jgi:hypothetical protein
MRGCALFGLAVLVAASEFAEARDLPRALSVVQRERLDPHFGASLHGVPGGAPKALSLVERERLDPHFGASLHRVPGGAPKALSLVERERLDPHFGASLHMGDR